MAAFPEDFIKSIHTAGYFWYYQESLIRGVLHDDQTPVRVVRPELSFSSFTHGHEMKCCCLTCCYANGAGNR